MRWRTYGVGLIMVLMLAACAGPTATNNPTATTLASPPPTVGGGATALPLRNEILSSVAVAAEPELFETPLDASPDPEGALIYFTATAADGAGVFKVPFAGGDSSALVVGPPFAAPRGLSVSPDGQWIYVADPEATGNDGRPGRIFAIASDGGPAILVAGTEGTAPRSLTVIREQNSDVLYFSGVDPASNQPAVMKLAVGPAGPLTVLAKGAPLVEPDGIAITKAGEIFVADRMAAGEGLGSVFRLNGAEVETIATKVRLGNPAGAALTIDDSALLVSALAADRDSAQVLLITLPGLEQAIVNKVIEANAGSGGIHRAHNRNLFAWADSFRVGRVYGLTP